MASGGSAEVAATITVIDWNLDGFTGLDAKLDLLGRFDWDVLLLQEVTTSSWVALRDAGTSAVWSRPHVPSLVNQPRYHSAIVARNDWQVTDLGPVADVPSPERTATARLDGEGVSGLVASLALPPGVSWGDAGKGRQADRIACWLSSRTGPIVVGIDANTPKTDRPRLEDCEWWNEQESLLLGPERVHGLRDAYRDLLEQQPELRETAVLARPDGPLAVSHVRGRGPRSTECRYDHVLVSPDIQVREVAYLWDEAVAAGSDHALVLAELELARSPRP